MKRLDTGEAVWDVTFDADGTLTAPDAVGLVDEIVAEGVVDLFVFCHGWGNAEAGARALYDAMFPLIRASMTGTGTAKLGFAGVYWPSLWFPPTPATPPPAPGSTQADNEVSGDLNAGTRSVSGADITASLLPAFQDPVQRNAIAEIGSLIDEGLAPTGAVIPDDLKRGTIARIDELLKSLVPAMPDGEYEDAGETALLFSDDPATAYQKTADAFGTAPGGAAQQGAADWFRKALEGAKDAVRVLSYTTMKARAGQIGKTGLAPILANLHQASAGVRVHLIGHSFGARLVSFALAGIDSADASPVTSLTLLQGAFSHWSFAHAQDNPFGNAGALNCFADRVHGPLVATFTVYDWAVGVWYPKASFLARQDSSAAVAGRWGGMGADAFQAVKPSEDRVMPADGVASYEFEPGTFYRVDAAAVINDVSSESFSGAHSDICKGPVADLIAQAAASSL